MGETLVNRAHHYKLEAPRGWVSVPTSTEFEFRPAGSRTNYPRIAVVYEAATERVDTTKLMKTTRDTLETALREKGYVPVIQEPHYNALTQMMTIEFELKELGVTTIKSTMICRIGERIVVGCVLHSFPLTHAIHRQTLLQMANSVQLDAGYERSITTGRWSQPIVREPQVQPSREREVAPIRERQPAREEQPVVTAPRKSEKSGLFLVLGGAFCSFVGAIIVGLGFVGIIVMMNRTRTPQPVLA
jgi:hypothetical protein